MIGGTYYAIAGAFPPRVWLATLPYGVVVASVLVGKHVDKRQPDSAVGVRSVPVLIGEQASLALNKGLFLVFYALVIGLVAIQVVGPWVLLTLLALPRLVSAWRVYSRPKPDAPPEGWTVWPLWYVGWAMLFNRRAGELFVLGLFLNLLVPQIISFFG
jgi:1,4-dihydroxy-2-naphthoate octaprenyltransferase